MDIDGLPTSFSSDTQWYSDIVLRNVIQELAGMPCLVPRMAVELLQRCAIKKAN